MTRPRHPRKAVAGRRLAATLATRRSRRTRGFKARRFDSKTITGGPGIDPGLGITKWGWILNEGSEPSPARKVAIRPRRRHIKW
jgi:hypothetical protein